jgi:rhodanese-related sulfurtransferase
MKKLFFITPLLSFVIAVMGCDNSPEKEESRTNLITTIGEQAKTIFEDVEVDLFAELIAKRKGQILDVRTPSEWEKGTLKGAIKMNYYDDNFTKQLSKLDKNKPVYVYCKSGGRSGKAAKQMQKMGFKKVINLLGGFNAWSGAGKEVVK